MFTKVQYLYITKTNRCNLAQKNIAVQKAGGQWLPQVGETCKADLPPAANNSENAPFIVWEHISEKNRTPASSLPDYTMAHVTHVAERIMRLQHLYVSVICAEMHCCRTHPGMHWRRLYTHVATWLLIRSERSLARTLTVTWTLMCQLSCLLCMKNIV